MSTETRQSSGRVAVASLTELLNQQKQVDRGEPPEKRVWSQTWLAGLHLDKSVYQT